MTKNRDKIIEKIKKLLALASNNPNEHEALAAAERVQVLLAEYNIKLEDVSQASEEELCLDFVMTEAAPWIRGLANRVASVYLCRAFVSYVPKLYKDGHGFVGEPHNVLVAKLMFAYLVDTIKVLAKAATAASEITSRREKVAYMASFKKACAVRVCRRLRERFEQAQQGQGPTGTNLPALVDLYTSTARKLDEFFAKLGKPETHKVKTTYSSLRGSIDGWQAGDGVGLDTQIGTRTNDHALLKG